MHVFMGLLIGAFGGACMILAQFIPSGVEHDVKFLKGVATCLLGMAIMNYFKAGRD